MTLRSVHLTGFAAIAAFAVGCRVTSFALSAHDDHPPPPPPPARVVYVEERHVCGPYCHEHYWDGARVVAVQGHRHGPGCGHHWDGSHWAISISGHSGH